MKFDPNSKMTTIAIYAFLVLAAAILFAQIIGNMKTSLGFVNTIIGYIQPMIYGFVIAFLLNPIMHSIENILILNASKIKLKPSQRRMISIIITYLFVIFTLSIFMGILLPQVIESLVKIVKQFPTYTKSLQSVYQNFIDDFYSLGQSSEVSYEIQLFTDKISSSIQNILNNIDKFLMSIISSILQIIAGFVSGIAQIIVGIIISIYLLSSKEKLFAQLKKVGCAILSLKVLEIVQNILIDTSKIFKSYITGAAIDAIIVGFICFLFMIIMGFFAPGFWQYSVIISVIVALTNVIPYFGPFLGAIPSALLLLTINPFYPIIFLVFILILQQIDGNIINPRIVGSSTGLPALWVVFAIMLFSGMFGIIGMFIGVPLFAVIYMLLKRLIIYLLRKKSMPIATKDYDSKENPLMED